MKDCDYVGVIHLHSDHSFDGTVPIGEIVEAARETGLDFLMLTDHSTLAARGREGWNESVLLIVGQEISPRFNHYIAFGLDDPIVVDEEAELPPQDYIDAVSRAGGMGFIAHPDHEGTEMFHVKHFPWVDWSVEGYTGIGIWDFMTDWQSGLTSFPRALAAYFFPAWVLRGPRKVTLARWDYLNRRRKVVGIGELDNHSTIYRFFGLDLRVFPFEKAFRFIRTHIVTDAPLSGRDADDIRMLLACLRRGRVFFALEYFREARGFTFRVDDGGHEALMGDDFLLDRSARLSVTIPYPGRIRVMRNGKPCCQEDGRELEHRITGGGNYRVEVFLKARGAHRPWIFSNPVYVRRES